MKGKASHKGGTQAALYLANTTNIIYNRRKEVLSWERGITYWT